MNTMHCWRRFKTQSKRRLATESNAIDPHENRIIDGMQALKNDPLIFSRGVDEDGNEVIFDEDAVRHAPGSKKQTSKALINDLALRNGWHVIVQFWRRILVSILIRQTTRRT